MRLCAPCLARRADGPEDLFDALIPGLDAAGLAERVDVKAAACLGPCDAPVALALQASGRAAYVFAGVVLPVDTPDVVATCRTYLDSPAGWIADARPCGRLRFCLRARLPAPGADG